MHIPPLIHDLALILGMGGAASLLFRKLKQPVVLGYLLAGILVGPHTSVLPSVADPENVKIWGELGVIFLLFLLGLEFSFRKLLEVGMSALIAACVEVVAMTALGFGLGKLLGWNTMDSLFLGGALAISSTTIIIKAFDELRIKAQNFASFVFGILIIEDLFAVLLLALLSTVAATQKLEGGEFLKQLFFLFAFLAAAIPIGTFLVPKFFKWVRSYLNDEARVILSLSLCLIMVVISTRAGFSAALGAFLMGAFMGETSEGERIERFLMPIRDLFGAIFFVSIGMQMDVSILLNNLGMVCVISAVTIVGKVLTTMLGCKLGRQDTKTSFQAGLCLGQIGEFSFIIATLGLSLNVVRADLYPMTVAVALLTTFLTPYFIRFAANSAWLNNLEEKRSRSRSPRLWDGHLVEFEIHPDFLHSGFSLSDLNLREKFGISIVALTRGDRRIVSPHPKERLMPFDRVVLFGTDKQLLEVEEFLRQERHDLENFSEARFSLERFTIKKDHSLIGKSLKESGIRERVQGIVLGIERGESKFLNPEPNFTMEEGDLIWLYSRRGHIPL